jgi:hypothetical protein
MALTVAILLAFSLSVPAMATDKVTLQSNVTGTAAYMYKVVSNPQVGSIGGEWAVIGLARSGYDVPDTYYQNYYSTVEAYVKACKGVLDERKYTEYSRVTVALSAIGKDPSNVAGYNLLTPLGDYDKTIWQGLNGPIWALIALDSGSYAMPKNAVAKTQATRQMYVDRILSCQLKDGGWSLTGKGGSTESADPDITGMALQALAKYTSDSKVQAAVDKALTCMSGQQTSDGGFSAGWGGASSESVVQVLVGLCELGISVEDARFVKNGHTLLDSLLTFRQSDGSFKHTADGSGNSQMSSEQGFYGIVAALRAQEGKNSLYRMSDAIDVGIGTSVEKGAGLEGKNADVKSVAITAPGTTFPDIVFSDNITAIEALASRGIITGMDDGTFSPDKSMTRAQFAAIVVRALGLTPSAGDTFTDVPSGQWYASYVGTANTYGIVNGRTATAFDPNGTITRQESAVMVARAAKLCGMDTDMDAAAVRDILAQFGDYVTVESWAQSALAFCYDQGILDQSDLNIEPAVAITRADVAQMLFNMLTKANLM